MEPDGKDVLVETGSFTVDRARALEKLMRFALPDPAWGALSLLRFAVASGATAFKAERGAKGELTLRFDGEPPTRAQLERPYDALFARAARGEQRGRDWAVGLLSLLRLEPAYVLVRAGHGGERLLLRLNRAEPETTEPAHDSERDTLVRFMPGPKTRSDAWAGLLPAVHQRCGMVPFAVSVDGEPWSPPRPELAEGRPVRAAGLTGWVRVPERAGVESRVELYRHGVLAGEVVEDIGGPPVAARVDCPSFRMNASQTAVVRDPAYRKALSAVSEAAVRLVADCAAVQAERAGQLTQFLQGKGLRGLWGRSVAAWLEPVRPRFVDALGNILGAASDQALDRQLAAMVKVDARRACWLREAAAGSPKGPYGAAAEAARACPLYLSPDLSWLTRAQLEKTVADLGVLPVADRLNPAPRDYHVLWTSCSGERSAAGRWFPGVQASDADDALAFEGRRKAGGARKGSLLARLGIVETVARRPIADVWEGELALPLLRPDAARVHYFSDDEFAQSVPVDGRLRFAAALNVRGPFRPQFARTAGEAVAKRLTELYAGAASDWSPGAGTEASEALRAHLFDALGHWGDKAPSWLSALPLFQCEAGSLDIRTVRRRLEAGETLFFAARPPAGPAPRLLFAHPTLDEPLLKALFPEARTAPLPLRPGWLAAWRPRPPAARRGGLDAVEDILREHGTYLGARDSPERRYLLEALAVTFGPWRGEPHEDAGWDRVHEHLAALPLFLGAEGAALTPSQLDARAASGSPVVAGPAPAPGIELVLDERERAAFAALWPEAVLLDAAAPPPETRLEPRAAAGERPRLAFAEPMLAAGEVEARGVRALVGFPPEPLPGVTVTLVGAEDEGSFVLKTPGAVTAGRMLLDASVWKGGPPPPEALQEAARELYAAFLARFLAGGCGVDPASERTRPYLLMLAAPRKGPAAPWADLRRRIDGLPLFPTLGGKTATLADLRRTAAKGVLRCARRAEPAPPEAADVPVVTTRALVEAALGKAVHDWSPETHAPDAGGGLEGRLEALLARVRGRKGIDPALTPRRGSVSLNPQGAGPLFVRDGPVWRVNGANEAARLALDEALDETSRAAYLLSALATAANRAAAGSTDSEDALFQALLAEAAAEDA